MLSITAQSSWRLVINFVLFQLGWFSCVLLPSSLLMVVLAFIIAVHFMVVVPKQGRLDESFVLLKTVFIGLCLEWLYSGVGVLNHANSHVLPPFWLLGIWLLFGTTLRHSLLWLRQKLWWAAALAALSAPGSYYAGANLHASTTLGEPVFFSLAVVSLSWAVVLPLLLLITLRATSKNPL